MQIAAVLLSVVVTSCSASESIPSEFATMAASDVGCVVKYGDEEQVTVGPLGPSDSETFTPNGYTSIRIGRTASDLIAVVTRGDAETHSAIRLNEFASGTAVWLEGDFIDGGNPGFRIRCWRGPIDDDTPDRSS